MNKWLVTLNNNRIEFDNYKEAINFFLKEISIYFRNHFYDKNDPNNMDIFSHDCMPNYIASFFFNLYNDRIIKDEEIIIDNRLSMLLSSLQSINPKYIKENSLESINKSYHYHYDDNDYLIDINIDYSPNEIIVKLDGGDDESHLFTNCFIMDDDSKKYFLESHQVCFLANKGSNLGKDIDIDITLEKISI